MVEKTLFTMAPNKINHPGISLTRYCIVRLESPHAALIALSLTGSQRLSHSFPALVRYADLLMGKDPCVYSKKPITFSYGNQGALHSLGTIVSASRSFSWFTWVLSATLGRPHSMWCPPGLWAWVTNTLLSISYIQCWCYVFRCCTLFRVGKALFKVE